MDLAKIRKKSLQSAVEADGVKVQTPLPAPVQTQSTLAPVLATPVSGETDTVQMESPSKPATIATAAEFPTFPVKSPEYIAVPRSPLETLLAGRTAAGCDEESILTEDDTSEIVAESQLEFLCFRVSDEIYGINIMDIKEIIKPREVTEVPRAPLFVSGVLSLRGTIIPIIDMRLRLGLARNEPTGKERVIVIKNENSFSGLLVDEVIQVVQVPHDALEAAPTVLDGIDRDFVNGIGRSDGCLIIILNLENISNINLY